MNKVLNLKTVEDTTLFKELITRKTKETETFISNLLKLCSRASDRAKLIPKFFPEYTLHNKVHFLRVTELMSIILGDNLKELNDIEIGLLILSAFYHDQGMVMSEEELKKLEKNDTYIVFRDNWFVNHSNYKEIKDKANSSFLSQTEIERLNGMLKELEAAMLTEFLRETHGQRSHDYIMDTFSTDTILSIYGVNVSRFLAKICLSHVKPVEWLSSENGLNYDENIGTYRVNTVFISLVLRLADILDFDSDRTPDVLFNSIHFTSPVSVSEWQKHRGVHGWEISIDLVRFSMSFEHPAYEKTAYIFLDWVEKELRDARRMIRSFPKLLSKYVINVAENVDRSRVGPKNEAYIYHDLEFNLSRDEIVKLLMTDKLYKNPSLFVRELLQNSLDALRLRKAIYKKDGFEWGEGKVFMRHFIDGDGSEVIECRDNGCGMDEDILKKYLGKIGRSFYRSPEFNRQRILLKEKGVDFEPCSQFGIGFMSCFMVGDRIQILTRKDYGSSINIGKPLIVEINGLGSLITIKEGEEKQDVGTTVRVFTRRKPILFDYRSDRIKLVLTIKGYALATEFPIKAVCEIDGIMDNVALPTSIDKKITFLEQQPIKKQKTFEVNLTKVDKNLRGFLRQTFLVDSNNIPSVENSEAVWTTIEDGEDLINKKNELCLRLKKNNSLTNFSRFYRFDRGSSLCSDGILISGYPGRSSYDHHEMMALGYSATKISSEHSFTIDTRGAIKPELSPSRTPLDDGSFLNTPVKWKKLQSLVDVGSGLIWEQILKHSSKGLTSETFWELLLIYEGSPLMIKSKILMNFLKLPTKENGWISLKDVQSFKYENNQVVLNTRNHESLLVNFQANIHKFAKTYINKFNIQSRISNLLFCLSELDVKSGSSCLALRKNFKREELPSNKLMSRGLTVLTFIPFKDMNNLITTTKYNFIVNFDNELCKVVLNSRFVQNKSDIQEFALSFVYNLIDLVEHFNKKDKPFDVKFRSRSMKYSSILYKRVDWSRYQQILNAPYKILGKNDEIIEITENDFDYWADSKQN